MSTIDYMDTLFFVNYLGRLLSEYINHKKKKGTNLTFQHEI